MEDDKRRKRRKRPADDTSEIGVIRVFSNPGPDAEDRVRRLVSLMIRYATQDERETPEKELPAEDSHADECAGEDA